jgi:hypothetical protein
MPYQDSKVTGGKVSLKNSSVAGEAKPLLVNGELALNSADGVLYHRDGQFAGAEGFNRIVSLTQAAYDALTPDANTLYIVSAE